jgi:hypothetical protein
MWAKMNPHTMLVGMQAGTTTLEKNLFKDFLKI